MNWFHVDTVLSSSITQLVDRIHPTMNDGKKFFSLSGFYWKPDIRKLFTRFSAKEENLYIYFDKISLKKEEKTSRIKKNEITKINKQPINQRLPCKMHWEC